MNDPFFARLFGDKVRGSVMNMNQFEGTMISGKFDEEENIYMLERVKHFSTQTALNNEQLDRLCSYLRNRINEGGQILSLYDQVLVPLNKDELIALLHDLEKVQKLYLE